MARLSLGVSSRLPGCRSASLASQAWRSSARVGALGQPLFRSSRCIVSLSTVLEKADNVLPCYAIIQHQLGAEVAETARRADPLNELAGWAHDTTWSWNGKELVMEGQGRSKNFAKNDAARKVLSSLVSQESELMDPTRNPMLAQWAIQWLNRRLNASMEVQEETPEDGPEGEGEGAALGQDGDGAFEELVDTSHACTWSCPQLPGEETVAHGSARSAAESRRQLMSALYKELPASLDGIIRNLPSKQEAQPQQTKAQQRGHEEASLGKTNVMHNEVCQQLAINKKHEYASLPGGAFECKLRWAFYDEARMAQVSDEVTAEGRTKAVAKGKANQAMLIKQGHLPDLSDDFHREVADMRQASEAGLVSDVVPRAKALMLSQAASTWVFFLPEVLRAVLAENDFGGLSEILNTLRDSLGNEGIPIDLWEELLDESSFSMRHYRLANSALQQLSSIPLAEGAFPGEQEKLYFKKFRHLLALERHGGLLHGIQQYELDPRMFCSVPLVDVHKMEADKVVLTPILEGGRNEIADGNRSLRNSDLILLVPLEALGDLRAKGQGGLEDGYNRSANWQHPGAWLASVTNVKGDSRDSRDGEDLKVHTKRISCFASDATGTADADGLSTVTAPIAAGRQYRLFQIAMETPTARMLAALRCLCRVRLPAWSENFEGRKPKFHFSDNLRQTMLGTPEVASALAVQESRTALGGATSDQVMERLVAPGECFASLTANQRTAVKRAMDEKLSLIQGPPGTGKTHVACAVIAAWVERYGRMGERILAVADSNVAADNMYRRLEAFGIQSVRVGQGKEVETMMGDQLWQMVKTAQVIIATCIGSGMEMLQSRGDVKTFHRVVIDECTQACEPAALVALGRGAEQAVLIGDHNQLPATVLSKVAKEEGLSVSLFERMVLTNNLTTTLLIEQRRMHSSIAEFPNLTFYQNQLVNAIEDSTLPDVPGFPWPNPECRVCFVDVQSVEQKRGYSAFNSTEAEAVATCIAQMLEAGVPAHELCVLTAYLAQREEIRRAIGDKQLWQAQLNLSIDTIDGYQGMERDIVLFSAARSNSERTLGFLADSRRMNVMLTRARRGVIVFGNGDMLRQSMDTGSHWRSWIEWAESKGAVMSAADLIRGHAAAATHQRPASMGMDYSAATPGLAATGGAFGQNGGTFGNVPSPANLVSPPAPPPPPQQEWQKVYSEQYARHYYWNTATQQTTWETPPGL